MSADFLDTNVFVYLFDDVSEAKAAMAERVVADAIRSGNGATSFQVVQETLNVIRGKLPYRATPEQATELLDSVLVPLWRVNPSAELYRRALVVRDRYRLSFYDSTIVAAAFEAGCERLITEDLQTGQVLDGLLVVNPFDGGDGARERIFVP